MSSVAKDVERLKVLRRKLDLLEARQGHIIPFTRLTKPDYQVNWHHRLMGEFLDKFIRKEIRFLMILTAPRHGKSELTSRRLPALLHGLYPNAEILAASYNGELATDMTVDVQRIMDSASYKEIFPTVAITPPGGNKSGYTRSSNEHEIVPYQDPVTRLWNVYQGSYRSAGVGGSFTGRGGDCLLRGTMIMTDRGALPIERLSALVGQIKVLGFNHLLGRAGFYPLLAHRSLTTKDLVKVTLGTGQTIQATPEHLFYIPDHGYVPADQLRCGMSCRVTINRDAQVQPLRKGIHTSTLRGHETFEARAYGRLLRQGVLAQTPQLQESAPVCGLLKASGAQEPQVLSGLSRQAGLQASDAQEVPELCPDVSTGLADERHVLKAVCRGPAFKTHEGQGQSEVCQWDVLLSDGLYENASDCQGPRQPHVRGLRHDKEEAACPPHQRGPRGQPAGEPDHNVRELPHHPPQIADVTISMVERISCQPLEVHDIQVACCQNFFAEGILVHNCVLLDDLVKNREDADSPAFRRTLKRFYTGAIRNRLEKNGSILLTQTCWHQDDLGGWIQSQMRSSPLFDQYKVLRLPAIRDDLENPDDPRLLGEALWPEKYAIDELEKIEATSGARDWNALYQQRPVAEGGNIIRRENINFFKVPPSRFDVLVSSWDFAVKDKSQSDFAVGSVYGRLGPNIYLLAQTRGRWSFPIALDQVRMIKRLYPQAHGHLVEPKAVGPAIVQVLKSEIQGLIEIEPQGDKVARLNAVAPLYQGGNVWFPDPSIAPWIEGHIEEMIGFPAAAHDDRVDAESQALNYLRQRGPIYQPLSGHGSGMVY